LISPAVIHCQKPSFNVQSDRTSTATLSVRKRREPGESNRTPADEAIMSEDSDAESPSKRQVKGTPVES